MNLKNIFLAFVAVLFLHYCSMPREIQTAPSRLADSEKNTGTTKPAEKVATVAVGEKLTPTVPPAPVKKTISVPEENIRTARIGEIFETGMATWYGQDFHGRKTASGEIYDMYRLTAAHKTLPFNTLVEVENLDNGKKVVVRINDRGPFIKERILDLSFKAAQKINTHSDGVSPVTLRVITPEMMNDGTAPPGNRVSGLPKETRGDMAVTTPPEAGTDSGQNAAATFPAAAPENASSADGEDMARISARYFLQAGAFGDRNNAERMMRKIRDILPGVTVEIREINGLFKISAGPVPNRGRAEELKRLLKSNRFEAFIREE